MEVLIAGRYSATYAAVDMGVSREGWTVEVSSDLENVSPTDAYGESVIDQIYRGGQHFAQGESISYKAGSTAPFWPWGALGVMGIIGRLASDVAAAMVMTSTAGTPAVAAPATVTANKSILAENNRLGLMFNSKLRTVPIRLRWLPYDAGSSVIKWFVTT